MKKYNSFLGAFFSGDSGQGGYNAAYGKSALAKLYTSQDPAEQQSAAEGLARVDPESASKWQQEQAKVAQQNLERKARMLASAPTLEAKQQLYASIRPEVSKLWAEAPEQYTPELDQMLTSWAGADGGKAKARSSHILADGTIAFMDEFGNLTRTNEKASNSYGFQTDADGNVYAQDRRGGTVAPAPMGSVQQGMPQVQAGADPMAGGLDRINQGVQVLKSNGVPVEKINEWADAEFAKLQGSVQGGVVEQAPPMVAGGQAKVAVKDDAPKPREAPVGYQFNPDGTLAPIKGGPADPAMKAADQAQSLDARKANEQRAALRQDAINFASAWLGKTPEEVAKMSPQEIREAVAKGGRITTGPVMGNIWGMGKIANPDLEAYKSSAAAKQARINNPTGPVTEGDFRAAEKSVFSADKPARVNADLIYQALTAGSQAQQAPKPAGPQPGDVVKGYRFKGGNPADPKSWEKQ